MRKLIVLLVILIIFLGVWGTVSKYLPKINNDFNIVTPQQKENVKIVTEESVTVNAVKKIRPSVVTILEEASNNSSENIQFGPFSIFGFPQTQDNQPQGPISIGSGFIISSEGLIVTNKHVVSATDSKYQIVTSDDKKFTVKKIYRDPLNDIAILNVDPQENKGVSLKQVTLGDSSHLQAGQYVIAIGTALGEFKNTVTTGVISGLGRGITAGDAFQGYAEKLDNVIQTDAAINPGNSGGPLVNSSAEVIGINTAIASGGQNIGFALPINTVKDSLTSFNEHGQFDRPYLGVSYKMISKDLALINSAAEGAYVQNVVKDSPADKAGIKRGDIIVKFDGKKVVGGDDELAKLIADKKPGDSVSLTVWRDGKTVEAETNLTSAPNQ